MQKPFAQNRPMIKYDVRNKLRGHVFACFCACLLPSLPSLVLQMFPTSFGLVNLLVADTYIVSVSVPMTVLSLLCTIFLSDPMNVRVAAFFLRLNRDHENLPSPLSVCDCFSPGYMRLVQTMLLRSLRILLWGLPPILVGALLPGSLSIVEAEGYTLLRIGGALPYFALVGVCLAVYRGLAYTMTPYVLAEHPELDVGSALRHSLALTRGHIPELFVLQLSFFGWLLLTSVTMLVGAIYTYPYIEGTMAAYYLAYTAPQEGGPDALAA